jgi:FKBP-type peptidyl-prolyl cis-trans isomerase SlyD
MTSTSKAIAPDHVVQIRHAMKTHLPDGTTQERPEEAFEFIFGVERQVPSLEKALQGACVGERLNVYIPAAELYGEKDPELVREIPKAGFIKQRLKEGQYYRQIRKGCLVSFKVLELRPKTVLADFNPPLSGISVSLDLEVLGIRQADKAEIDAAIEAQLKRSIGCG